MDWTLPGRVRSPGRFVITPSKRVFLCRPSQAKGGVIDMAMHVLGDFGAALEFINGEAPNREPPAPPRPTDRNDEARAAFAAAKAAEIMRELRPLRGSAGEAYPRDVRRIDVDAIADALTRIDAIGWHPAVYFNAPHYPGPDDPPHPLHGRRLGCIVGAMTDPMTGERTGAISRTYLDGHLRKIAKAKTLGRPPGVIRLDEDASVTYGLGLGEGVESTLAAMARGFRPCWATSGTALMAAFPVLTGIEALTLFADNDPKGGGLKAAQTAQGRWLAAGREARVFMPERNGDVNDLALRAAS